MIIFDSSSGGNYNSLYHYSTRLLGIPNDDTTTVSKSDFVSCLNVWLRNVSEEIWKAQNYWKFDDNNKTDMAEATTDLVDNQQDYELEVTIYDVESVAIKDINGNYQKLTPVTLEDSNIAEQEFEKTAGVPRYYKLRGNVISLFPKPDKDKVTLTDGLVLQIRRDIVPIIYDSPTSMSQEPGIPRQFHDLLGIGVALDQSLRLGLIDKWQQLNLLLNSKNKSLREHYSLRMKNVKTNLRPSLRSGL